MLSISEIREKYKKRNIYKYLVGIPFIIVFIVYFVALYEKITQLLFPSMLIIMILFMSMFFIPKLSPFELIRFHLAELVNSLNEESLKKSEYHLNELAYNIKEFDDQFEDNFILNSVKTTLKNFWDFLKYGVYPSIKENQCNTYAEVFRDIDFAFKNEDIVGLNRTIESFNTCIHNEDVLLPYEKPSVINRIISLLSNNFHKNFVFRLVCVIIILLTIGYLISIKTTLLEFNTTFISALIVIALGISKEIN